jgi:hypothetical protein
MSNVVKVGREIEFVNDAKHRANIVGDMQEKRNHFSDRFMGVTLDVTNTWVVTVPGTNDTIAITSEELGGAAKIRTGDGNDDSCMLSTALVYSASTNSSVEARIDIEDVTNSAVFFGFSDAKGEGNTYMAIAYTGNTEVDTATDAVGFLIDPESTTIGASSLLLVNTKAGTQAVIDTGIDWADNDTRNLRVDLDTTGNATFWVDGVASGYKALAITAATPLCGTVQASSRTAAASTVWVRSFDAWSDLS